MYDRDNQEEQNPLTVIISFIVGFFVGFFFVKGVQRLKVLVVRWLMNPQGELKSILIPIGVFIGLLMLFYSL